MDPYAINLEFCRARQQRLLQHMRERNLDLAIVTQIEHVQWLSGVRFGWMFQPAAALTAEGELIVVAPQKAPEAIAADEVAVYEAKKHSTLRNDQRKASSEVLRQVLEGRSRPERIGVEFWSASSKRSCWSSPRRRTRSRARSASCRPIFAARTSSSSRAARTRAAASPRASRR